jgi:RNA recognition motif-containing protein
MEAKLYVGNLPFTATEEDLSTLFAKAGVVKSVALIKDRDSGRSKGFAFVEMSTQVEAEKAISMFNGYTFDSRQLTVNVARPREERPRGGGGGYGGAGGGYGRNDRGGGGGHNDRNRGGNRGSGSGDRRY